MLKLITFTVMSYVLIVYQRRFEINFGTRNADRLFLTGRFITARGEEIGSAAKTLEGAKPSYVYIAFIDNRDYGVVVDVRNGTKERNGLSYFSTKDGYRTPFAQSFSQYRR